MVGLGPSFLKWMRIMLSLVATWPEHKHLIT